MDDKNTAKNLIESAGGEAENLIESAGGEAENLIESAGGEAENLIESAGGEAENLIESARVTAENLIESARVTAENLIESARGEAENLIENTVIEINDLKDGGRIEVEILKKTARVTAENLMAIARITSENLKKTARVTAENLMENTSENLKKTARVTAENLMAIATITAENLKKTARVIAENLMAIATITAENLKKTARVTAENLMAIARIHSSQSLKIAHDELEQIKKIKSEKLLAIGELSSRLSHDLRNPLNIIGNSVEIILGTTKEALTIENCKRMQSSIDRMAHQVEDVMDFVRTRPLNLSIIPINVIIKNAASSIKIPKEITLEIPQNDIEIFCDIPQMMIVFNNIIYNAVQKLNEGGVIQISAEQSNDKSIIKIQDSGSPIPDDDLSCIFEPLFTTKQTGTGLGLASCKKIIESHGGELYASNNPTTFTIKIPRK
jgi:signal transduction histidine kinase/vacuolar-type H+-ATPase subunit H